jgi:LmbE family N-acetylglucosaminyl deacetylase
MLLNDVTSALAVFAHPDDAEWMFGGTVARLTANGAEVNYVVCTDGSNGTVDTSLNPADVAATRASELRAAADVLGVKEIVFLGYRNDELEVTRDLRRDIVRQIRRFRPDVILTMAPQRLPDAPVDILHADHMAASEAALVAAYPESYMPLIYPDLLDEGLDPYRVTEVRTSAFRDADLYVDVTDQVNIKMTAIMCHASQNGTANNDADWMLEHKVGPAMVEAGKRIGCRYAERYLRVPIKY